MRRERALPWSPASAGDLPRPAGAGAARAVTIAEWQAPEVLSHARYLATRTFGSLDGLRAAAIVAVVWHHAHGWHHDLWKGADGWVENWAFATRGLLGVDLFFVISGFLIVTLLLRERRRRGTIGLRAFYARRALRIFPAYYLLLAILAVVAYLAPMASSAAVRRELPYAALYLSNLVAMVSPLGITWSLAAEEQFYLVVPTLEKYRRRAFVLSLPLIYVVVSLPAFGFFPQLDLPEFFRKTTFGPILLGVMLAHVLDQPLGFRLVGRVLGAWWAPLAAAALVLALCTLPGALEGWLRIAIHWSLLVLVASCVVRERHALSRLLSVWAVKRIGVVSYGIYLFHLLGLYAAFRALRSFTGCSVWTFFLVALLLSWGIAEVSYRLYESRFLALKDRVAGRWSRDTPVTAAASSWGDRETPHG
jgi:peptidoglycan/LPS O-acetylase OafA/YrhL